MSTTYGNMETLDLSASSDYSENTVYLVDMQGCIARDQASKLCTGVDCELLLKKKRYAAIQLNSMENTANVSNET